MSQLLDTNICVAHFRRPAGLAHRFIQYGGGLYVPTVVLGELYTGEYHMSYPAPLLRKIAELLNDVAVLPSTKLVPNGSGNSGEDSFGKALQSRHPT